MSAKKRRIKGQLTVEFNPSIEYPLSMFSDLSHLNCSMLGFSELSVDLFAPVIHFSVLYVSVTPSTSLRQRQLSLASKASIEREVSI